MTVYRSWGGWDATDDGRRGSEQTLDTPADDVHSALVPPGALHHRVTAALANWQLDHAEELLADVERDPSPYAAIPAEATAETTPASLGRAWADTAAEHDLGLAALLAKPFDLDELLAHVRRVVGQVLEVGRAAGGEVVQPHHRVAVGQQTVD